MIKEAIVVEGKDDRSALVKAVDAEIIETHGFGLNLQTLERIKTAKERTGVIIFTDPDRAGENIRRKIEKTVPGCLHAYLPLEEAMRGDNIGIENATSESIVRALEKVRTKRNLPRTLFSMDDLSDAGLVGETGSAEMRSKLGRELGIGYGNAKRLLSRLNHYEITREEFAIALERICQQ
jgi:ribonuclease M5